MRRLSIKAKVTLWYTGLLVAVLMLVMVFVLYISDNFMLYRVRNNLIEVVISTSKDLELSAGVLDLSDLERYYDGVSILVHTTTGFLIFGQYPAGFPENTTWANDSVQTISLNGKHWLVYDYLVEFPQHESIFVRGIASVDTVTETINAAAVSALVIFPLLLLFAALGGYRITKRAFRPIRQIADAAAEINGGDDLSKRIGLPEASGEIFSLAQTFDSMFDRLQKSFERERQFTADVSHELRTPTAVIMSQSEYALSEFENPEEVKDSLNVILRQAQKMSGLIAQLLLLTHMEKQKEKMSYEQFDCSELAEIVLDEMSLSAKASDISLVPDIEPGITIRADHILITRLLMNLLSNGIKYGKNGGFVKLGIAKKENLLVGKVTDNGIGLEKEHLEKIWDRFYQVNPSRTADNTESMGLGLSMVKWIVEAHAGTIEVQSIPGEMTIFTFRLPLSDARDAKSGTED